MDAYFGSPFSPKGVPLLLWVTMYWSALVGGLVLLALLLLPFGVELPGFSMSGQPVAASQFFRDPIGVWFIPLGCVLSVLAYGLFTRRAWSRTVIFGLVLALCFVSLGQALLHAGHWGDAILSPFVLLVAWWYLFVSRGPAQYYRLLRSRTVAGAGA